tara:strand:+ start:2516 stop:3394 length:879 start_codon:yes stop_codon:yes gene_type:complete
MTDWRLYYYHFGLELRNKGSQLLGNCPFCDKDDHFFVNKDKGMYDCKVCSESGNSYSFLTALHKKSLSINPMKLGWIVDNRGLLPETLRNFGIVNSSLNPDRWLIPCWNEKKSVVNLYQAGIYDREKGKLEVRSSPSPCKQQLYLSHLITKNTKTAVICEGHWDALAMYETLAHLRPPLTDNPSKNNPSDQYPFLNGAKTKLKATPDFSPRNPLLKQVTIVGLPGATTIKPEWMRKLKNKHIILLQDNDASGKQCVKMFLKRVEETNTPLASLQTIEWKQGDPNDIRDLLSA